LFYLITYFSNSIIISKMAKRIAINGFGRIGRLTLRSLLKNKDVEVVAINDLTSNDVLAHLFKYDSAQGMHPAKVTSTDKFIQIGNKKIVALSERDPANLPWKKLKVDVVLECTGIFTSAEKAGLHVKAGAKRVVISAPAKGEGVQTIVIGVNDADLDASQTVFSNASCTTNCLAPLVKVIDENWGFVQGSMTTTHAYTGDQNIQDGPHKDLRRARAAGINIVPTSTGAASAVSQVYPSSEGKMFAMALRVPVVTGSMVELNVIIEKDTTVADINKKFEANSKRKMKGILEYVDAPIVSCDIIGNTHSSIFDSGLTQVAGKLIKVVSWYDNEAGYSARLADMCRMVSKLAEPKKTRAKAKPKAKAGKNGVSA
jgi:glyceraldehyde 3-phosphate dehydrogenase